MRKPPLIGWILLFGLCGVPVFDCTADVPEVKVRTEIENCGQTRGLAPVEMDDASGGRAMALASDAAAVFGLDLERGDYTLLIRTWAPAGDQDGFFIEIDRKRTRRVAGTKRWQALAVPFEVNEASTIVPFSIIGQEAGLRIDQIAVLKGKHKDDEVRFAKLPAAGTASFAPLDELPRIALPVQLRQLPAKPFAAGEAAIFHESFNGPVTGVTGTHHQGPGKWGQALYVDLPDGRFVADVGKLGLGNTGTIEWWVKPRPQIQLWRDQGWHWFLHCEPASVDGIRLDLSRHVLTGLRLAISAGEDGPQEQISIPTRGLSPDVWHHLLLSWDLAGKRKCFWLLVDGKGNQLTTREGFPRNRSTRAEFGNTPSNSDLPFLPMDGGIDEIRITATSVANRLAK